MRFPCPRGRKTQFLRAEFLRQAVSIILFSFLLTACGGRSLNKNAAQELIVKLPHQTLTKKDVYIESVTQAGERNAIVEAHLQTAFRFEKTGGRWVLKEVRIGHGQWEDIDSFLRALDKVKIEETRALLDKVAEAIQRYREKNGKLPAFTDFETLTDALNPEYMTPLVRLDAGRRTILAEMIGLDTVRLTSAGPDGRFGTADDIVLTRNF